MITTFIEEEWQPWVRSPRDQSVCWLTYLETAHVVDLGAEGQRSKDVDGREDDPEPHIVFSKHLGIRMGLVRSGVSLGNSVKSLSLTEAYCRKQNKAKQIQPWLKNMSSNHLCKIFIRIPTNECCSQPWREILVCLFVCIRLQLMRRLITGPK